MRTPLFLRTADMKGNERVVKSALDALEPHGFLRVLKSLLEGTGYGTDGVSCFYPIDDDDDYEGVCCHYLDEEVIVSEEEFMDYLGDACQRYVELHPEKKDELEQIISQSRSS